MEVRKAVRADIAQLEALIDASIRELGSAYYEPNEIDESLVHVFGVDTTMIDDGSYFVVESDGRIVGAGGWSHRKTPFGGDQATPVRDAEHRIPGHDPAVIRAMFVHPEVARQGIGRLILHHCEQEAFSAGYIDLELVATLSGKRFYERMGYRGTKSIHYAMPTGTIEFVHMIKPG